MAGALEGVRVLDLSTLVQGPQAAAMLHDLGEHGVGRLKVDDLERYGDPAKLTAMRAIKQALDPKGIMNPGAVLRAATNG